MSRFGYLGLLFVIDLRDTFWQFLDHQDLV